MEATVPDHDLKTLALSIKNNGKDRMASLVAGLEEKYADEASLKKSKKATAEPTEEEFLALQQKIFRSDKEKEKENKSSKAKVTASKSKRKDQEEEGGSEQPIKAKRGRKAKVVQE